VSFSHLQKQISGHFGVVTPDCTVDEGIEGDIVRHGAFIRRHEVEYVQSFGEVFVFRVTLDESSLEYCVHLDVVGHHHVLHFHGSFSVSTLYTSVQQASVSYVIRSNVLFLKKCVEYLECFV